MEKYCNRCGKTLSVTMFYKDRTRKDGLSNKCKSCADLAAKKNRLGASERERLFRYARMRAARRGREFTLDPEDIMIPERCPVLNVPMKRPSIDRMDNSRGYVKGNIRVISTRANLLKNNAAEWELQAVLEYMRKIRQERLDVS